MRTADIEVGKTYLERSSYSSDIYEVLEIQTQEQRYEALRSEHSGKHWERSHAASKQGATIRVKVIASYHSTSGVIGKKVRSEREEWVRPQKLNREIDLGEFERGVEERKRAREARRAKQRARVEAVRQRLADTGLPLPSVYGDGSVSREVAWRLEDYDKLVELLDALEVDR